ncbi:thiamine pyrophosphate-dependent enzyme [Nocardiopsis sp. JB363]|uniref:thiamine pyrophosphate-dependent enzyme n=1 Tax=Nocardiopsis sp. JB363 TaxID=1434837 RepID=UPI00097A3CDD|nr:thiamine pyrophosphate-dependent enzyme [Nocardiopsis sp. JB363]SIO84608.1 Transketolase, N-terminal section [Nocardiopsis sp. JB363]
MTTAATFSRYADLPALIGLMEGDEKHHGASASTLDVLWVLYDRILDITPGTAEAPDRDRFLLSKGHGPAAYYAVLAAKGFLDVPTLRGWTTFDSPLGHHPDRVLVPGVEIGSGSLGHGMPLGLGTALGLRAQGIRRADGTEPRVVVLVGDGELDEGSNHETIAAAGRLGVDNLTVVAIDNGSASHGWPGGIGRRFEVEGWEAREVNGRDHTALHDAFTTSRTGRPLAVVARVRN